MEFLATSEVRKGRVYPADMVENMFYRFKSQKLRPDQITIYYDMDNTLARFSIWGKEPEALEQMHQKGYYRNLPPLDGGEIVIPVLQRLGFNVKILSACIDSKFCREEKLEWLKEYFPTLKRKDILLCNVGQDKSQFVEDITKSILVDDYWKNLLNWMAAGGFAIKKSYSGKKRNIPTIRHHSEILLILKQLEII